MHGFMLGIFPLSVKKLFLLILNPQKMCLDIAKQEKLSTSFTVLTLVW